MKPESTLATALPFEIVECLKRSLAEDIGPGDVTTNSIVPADAVLRGRILAKDAGVVAGLDVAHAVLLQLEDQIGFIRGVAEGAPVTSGAVLANISGSARALLTGERTALNFLGRMSGIATLTRQFVAKVSGTSTRIIDTRKTAPGLRAIDKLAVRRGGGENHRMGLFDMVLIKDNHIDFAGSITAAVERARAATTPRGLPTWGPRSATNLEIEVEARTLEDVKEALDLKVDRILLDNMTPEVVHEAVALNGGRAILEASGNVTLENVREIAETGVDFISVGSLTHSARVFDVSLKWTG
ncbi:carboxylating nicotinate-nucleotide diphosphorylase [soil metagenome]